MTKRSLTKESREKTLTWNIWNMMHRVLLRAFPLTVAFFPPSCENSSPPPEANWRRLQSPCVVRWSLAQKKSHNQSIFSYFFFFKKKSLKISFVPVVSLWFSCHAPVSYSGFWIANGQWSRDPFMSSCTSSCLHPRSDHVVPLIIWLQWLQQAFFCLYASLIMEPKPFFTPHKH